MKLSTTTTLFASLAYLVSASAPPKASVQASIATAGNRAILALDNAKQATSTFTDTVQAAINSLETDPAVKEDLNAYVSTLSRRIDPSINKIEGLVELYGPAGKIWRINQDTPSDKLKESTDRISAIYKEYPYYRNMPEAVQEEFIEQWDDFMEQMNHVDDPPLGSNDGRVHISSKSRIADSSDKSDETSCPFVKLWKRLTDRTFVFRGGEMVEKKEDKEGVKKQVKEQVKEKRAVQDKDELSKDELARVQEQAEEVRKRYDEGRKRYDEGRKRYDEGRKRYDEARKRYDEGWKRAREGDKKTGEGRKSRHFEL